MKRLILIAMVVLMSSSIAFAQDFCKGDHDYDGDCDSDDVTSFLEDFGRSQFNNPCPPDGPAPVAKTGQTACYDEDGVQRECEGTGEDGEYQSGVAWPNPRFTDRGDGTIQDNLTGLIWLRDANCITTHYPGFDNDGTAGDGTVTWQHALDFVAGINDGTYPICGAGYTDWKLPNKRELISLTHDGYYYPALTNTSGNGQWSQGDPFNNVQSYVYWSSTTYAFNPDEAWLVFMSNGFVGHDVKSLYLYVWPVRGGRECIEDETRPCGTDLGECEYGVETCTDGFWGGCVGGVPPTDEVCDDGLDNDCDGEIDEGCEMLIDTGQPTDSTYNWSLHNNPTSTVWLAGEFTLDQDYILNSIQFFVSHQVSGTVTMVIYEDSGEVPDISSELFSDTFYGQSGYDANWDGLTGLNWYLPQGTYWVAIEPRLPDEYYYGGVPSDAPFPLNNYAAYNGSNGFYVESDLLTFGLRITGRLPTP